jgi:hypothetical protein
MVLQEILSTEARYVQSLGTAITVIYFLFFSHTQAYLNPIEEGKLIKNKDFLTASALFKFVHEAHKQVFSTVNMNNARDFDLITMFYSIVHNFLFFW